jgi:hypothetical protein
MAVGAIQLGRVLGVRSRVANPWILPLDWGSVRQGNEAFRFQARQRVIRGAMTDAERLTKLTALVAAYAKSAMLIADRLKALELAMQADYSSRSLWDNYAKEIGWEVSRADRLKQRRELRADQELDSVIAELGRLSKG